VAILPAFDQAKDMACSLINGGEAALIAHDSSGLSRAELWQEIPTLEGWVQLVNRRPLPDSTALPVPLQGVRRRSSLMRTVGQTSGVCGQDTPLATARGVAKG
jgi:hypothetical protein